MRGFGGVTALPILRVDADIVAALLAGPTRFAIAAALGVTEPDIDAGAAAALLTRCYGAAPVAAAASARVGADVDAVALATPQARTDAGLVAEKVQVHALAGDGVQDQGRLAGGNTPIAAALMAMRAGTTCSVSAAVFAGRGAEPITIPIIAASIRGTAVADCEWAAAALIGGVTACRAYREDTTSGRHEAKRRPRLLTALALVLTVLWRARSEIGRVALL
jgi:hypothetical protein